MAPKRQALKNKFVKFFGHQKKPAFMLTHGEICNIQLLKNLVLNPKDGKSSKEGKWLIHFNLQMGKKNFAIRK